MSTPARHSGMAAVRSWSEPAPGLIDAWLDCPPVAANAWPGQFVMVRTSCATDPLLPRPISVAGRRDTQFRMIYRERGRGTTALRHQLKSGRVHVTGPLGTAYTLHSDRPALLVCEPDGAGGGELGYLAVALRHQGCPSIAVLHAGAGHALAGAMHAWIGLDVDVEPRLAHPDDSGAAILAEHLAGRPAVYAHGDRALFDWLRGPCDAAAAALQHSFNDTPMGCGTGICMTCMIPTPGGHLRACTEGPVVDAALFR